MMFVSRRLMRPLFIDLVQEAVEAVLLLQAIEPWRGRFLLEGEVHPLMTSVLLWMAWFDALDGDAEPEPPHRQL